MAFREDGRGSVVMLDYREEPHYGFLPELEERLGDEPDAKRLLSATVQVLDGYNPENEAVVIDSRPEGIFVLIVSDGGTRMVGEILFEKAT